LGLNYVYYGLKGCILEEVDDLFVTAYYREERSGHGIFDLLKLNIPNNHSRKEK
jgi:hypothetical protein